MKSLKAAAVVAGAVAVAGSAAPAFAHSFQAGPGNGLNGAVSTLTDGSLDGTPLQHTDVLNSGTTTDSVAKTLKSSTAPVAHKPLLGGLPLHN
ncbi:hypothetical protein [Streptomyces anandii]|uniref:hypothetical protein n=1 Tax=Streptomyces anandii TaxID=285454 RepID=UPI0037BA1FCC